VLNAIEPLDARTYVFERVLPFELEVMQTRLKYWAGDHMGYLDALNALLKKCRNKCRAAGDDATLVPMWKERGARVALIVASQMVEMRVCGITCLPRYFPNPIKGNDCCRETPRAAMQTRRCLQLSSSIVRSTDIPTRRGRSSSHETLCSRRGGSRG